MKTVFLRAIEAAVDDKAAVLREAARGEGPGRYEVDVATFAQVPRSPFAYWVSDGLRRCFAELPAFESEGQTAKQGLATADDFRFVRLATEVSPERVGQRWFPFAKGGAFSRFFAEVYLVVDWRECGRNVHGYSKAFVRNPDFFLRPGLTWPRRTTSGLSLRVMPAGCIFADKGPAAFVEGDDPLDLLALAAVVNSRPFGALVALQLAAADAAARSYEVGVIQRTPVPDLTPTQRAELAALARRAWSLKRGLDTATETSHAFTLPALLQVPGGSLQERADAWVARVARVEAELASLQAEIDDRCFDLYGISAEDRASVERGFGAAAATDTDPATDDDDEPAEADAASETDAAPMVASLLSWAVGVAFGRFDIQASGVRRQASGSDGAADLPPASCLLTPESPFDPLPVCSPGMLSGDDGLPLAGPPPGYPVAFPADGLLVDDPGHPRDLLGPVRTVLELVLADADARWHEAAELLGAGDLRGWLAHELFPLHVKRYSKSRRKAPICWQLATASGSYSVWLAIHRATADTLFRVLNELVGPKLDHEAAGLHRLTQEAGPDPSASERRDIDQQETFVSELRSFKGELARVAPLWNPDLDDGVIINFAPLWRLVPQHRQWQKECKTCWDKLVAGDYDWAHLAMHLWPERVVPKCAKDRSLAIAHDLEQVFWVEDEDGKWQPRSVEPSAIEELIRERTSPAVKAALEGLLSAPAPVGTKKATRRRTKARTGRSARKPPARTQSPKSTATAETPRARPPQPADDATLTAVREAIASVAGGASKSDVLAATGLSDGEWNRAIQALLERGEVTRTGAKRGTRYHSGPGERS